jgi:DNA repair ATPase RecN
MPRINHVNKARKDQGTCTCGAAVRKGDSYKWIKPRYGSKQIRCDNCHFRDSDLTSSDKLARCYDARDNALDQLGGWSNEDSVDDLRNIVEDMTSELREVAEEYQQSADNIRDSFTESSTADECEERANEIEGWAEEVESAVEDIEEFDEDEKKEE